MNEVHLAYFFSSVGEEAAHREKQDYQIPTDVFSLIDAHCLSLLGDPALAQHLASLNFTVALVDLIANECSLALAHRLGLPVVGFWGFSFQGGEVCVCVCVCVCVFGGNGAMRRKPCSQGKRKE
ncbi:hypothetical protein E2C01_049778 [Portunus trituberculatus]|uniref:Uncharacterized protein n=1 Tax=Portunus trituberculatus TaxID=210409 RepID=A0A5B7GES4_PORTR|nr:hypothetical protein [Portunus trituberculatus]